MKNTIRNYKLIIFGKLSGISKPIQKDIWFTYKKYIEFIKRCNNHNNVNQASRKK